MHDDRFLPTCDTLIISNPCSATLKNLIPLLKLQQFLVKNNFSLQLIVVLSLHITAPL